MNHSLETSCCPHCGELLQRFELPDNTGWPSEFQLACFNDDCPYFTRGWERMRDEYAVGASYRYRLDPTTGEVSPLAVWSSDALKDRILDQQSGDGHSDPRPDVDPDNGGAS